MRLDETWQCQMNLMRVVAAGQRAKQHWGSGSEPTLEPGTLPNRTFTEVKQTQVRARSQGRSATKGSGFWSASGPGHGLVVQRSGHSSLW